MGAAGRRDRTTLYWQTGATAGADATFDAWKVLGPNHPSLWTEAGVDKLSINGLPLPVGTMRIPLNLNLPQTGTHTLATATLTNVPATWNVQLEDQLTGTVQALTAQTAYRFTTTTAGAQTGRFWLVVNGQGVLANASTQPFVGLTVYPNPARGVVQVSLPAAHPLTKLRRRRGAQVVPGRSGPAVAHLL